VRPFADAGGVRLTDIKVPVRHFRRDGWTLIYLPLRQYQPFWQIDKRTGRVNIL